VGGRVEAGHFQIFLVSSDRNLKYGNNKRKRYPRSAVGGPKSNGLSLTCPTKKKE
jgi:hypothetical protein